MGGPFPRLVPDVGGPDRHGFVWGCRTKEVSKEAVVGGDTAADGGAPMEPPTLDESQPSTTLQIVLASGKRITRKFNLTHTIRHVQAFIARYEGGAGRGSPPLLSQLSRQSVQPALSPSQPLVVERHHSTSGSTLACRPCPHTLSQASLAGLPPLPRLLLTPMPFPSPRVQ